MAFYTWLQLKQGKMRHAYRITHLVNGPDAIFLEVVFPHPQDSGGEEFFFDQFGC
jgi:hypothetical protein